MLSINTMLSILEDLERPIRRSLLQKRSSFGTHYTNLNEDRPILSAAKMYAKEIQDVCGYSRDSSGWGRQTTLGLSTTTIFGDLGGYFFGNRPAIL